MLQDLLYHSSHKTLPQITIPMDHKTEIHRNQTKIKQNGKYPSKNWCGSSWNILIKELMWISKQNGQYPSKNSCGSSWNIPIKELMWIIHCIHQRFIHAHISRSKHPLHVFKLEKYPVGANPQKMSSNQDKDKTVSLWPWNCMWNRERIKQNDVSLASFLKQKQVGWPGLVESNEWTHSNNNRKHPNEMSLEKMD